MLVVSVKIQKRVLFCSHQCVTVSQDKAHLLERCSLFKVCLYMYGSVCVLPRVLVIRAIAEPHTVTPLAEFNVLSVNKTSSVQNIRSLLFRIGGLMSPMHPKRLTEEHQGNKRRNRLDFFFSFLFFLHYSLKQPKYASTRSGFFVL